MILIAIIILLVVSALMFTVGYACGRNWADIEDEDEFFYGEYWNEDNY